MLIERKKYFELIRSNFKVNRIVALLGPRQCGKTTLARDFIKKYYPNNPNENYFD